MNTNQIPLLVIGGPTGVGKTELSINLAKRFNGEIINGDSLQVYRHLDIGTGKITKKEMEEIPHHLLDILDVDEDYDASQFKEAADEVILDIYKRGRLPIVVGGTGLYLSGLLYNLEFGGEGSHNVEIRAKYEEKLKQVGKQALWEVLLKKDPKAAAKIPYQNSRRVIRALEVIQITGEKFSDQESHRVKKSVYNELLLVLDRPRSELYNRINQRVLQMIKMGLESEARWLYEISQSNEYQSIKGIGYKEWWPYFEGDISIDNVIEKIQQNSRRYAKRQLTWFRNRMKEPHWIDVSNKHESLKTAEMLVETHLVNKKEDN